ncbi:MAG: TldD/PmbA family protein, partial [Myxococcota bacterium]|nr:TldD/PmbA family protein [Myxococcota bacterium]
MLDSVAQRFLGLVPDRQFCSLRVVREHTEEIRVRRGVVQPVHDSVDQGAMVTVVHDGGLGFAATSDMESSGLARALGRASDWARYCAGRPVHDFSGVAWAHPKGRYVTPVANAWLDQPLADRIARIRQVCEQLPLDPRIVDWEASVMFVRTSTLYVTSDGGRVEQELFHLSPNIRVVANEGSETQVRTLGSLRGTSQQGGAEVLGRSGFEDGGPQLARQAIELLDAPQCPEGSMSILLDPDQMMLQIHESIGHPLELDRILGDERNYAGTSFVDLDMFGTYRYGSPLLHVTFDPSIPEQYASYGYDDEGTVAERTDIIRDGVLLRPLGAQLSQARAGQSGVANARASSWNRPPIDRMANLNLEPGDQSFEELVGQVERGVWMRTNKSWSIDDSRNKFQFGCELGQLIEEGQLKGLVQKPNYRGISETFWRSLSGVG